MNPDLLSQEDHERHGWPPPGSFNAHMIDSIPMWYTLPSSTAPAETLPESPARFDCV